MLELLAPAGNLACAEAAIHNGANAVYLGYSAFSARQSADNFDEESLRKIVRKAHVLGVKVYVAMNTLVKESEREDFIKTLLLLWKNGADAIIMQDALLGKALHEQYPEIVLHLSTQAGVCNLSGAKFAKACGFSRVILARETPISEIEKIAACIETEVFVQGALCTCFSGQCYFSSFAGGNSGNRGRCKQPCRKLYAYDRNGNEQKNYALSLSDLCVGEDIHKLIKAGVTSFKIEGRMRRAEYVAAAVAYYRGLLDGEGAAEQALSDLKRTYNRGNYTKGLTFGQDKRFLSTAVQGHLGEKVGVIKVQNGKYLVESRFLPKTGDAFKILRDGKELCGATYQKSEGRYFSVSSKYRLKNGDAVFVTTDTEVNARLLQKRKTGKISLSLYFKEGQRPLMECDGVCVMGDQPLQSAQNRPLTEEDLKQCFLKTDELPIKVRFEKIQIEGRIFLAKSELNALRRRLYEKIGQEIRTVYDYISVDLKKPQGVNGKSAIIASDFRGVTTDIAVYKPNDYAAPVPKNFTDGNFEKYLYYPAFATQTDEDRIAALLKEHGFDGIYAENYGGLAFAQAQGVKLFAGTGFNLTNRAAVNELLGFAQTAYYAISKELNAIECADIVGEKAFALSLGGIKLMDLCYCPFQKKCGECDKKNVYALTDENGRKFPVRRYTAADGACRFEVYNCASLIGKGAQNAGKLLDCSLGGGAVASQAVLDEEEQRKLYPNHTSGHFKRGVL